MMKLVWGVFLSTIFLVACGQSHRARETYRGIQGDWIAEDPFNICPRGWRFVSENGVRTHYMLGNCEVHELVNSTWTYGSGYVEFGNVRVFLNDGMLVSPFGVYHRVTTGW